MLALATSAVIGLAAAPLAAAAAVPPTITSAFTPALIGAGGSTDTALSFTITNPNASSLSAIGISDTLPPDLTVDDPNGENGSCGSSSVVTAVPQSQLISLSGGSLKAGASCTVSVSLIAAQPGVLQNNTGSVSSSAGSSTAGDAETLTVLAPPTVSLTHVKNNAKYTFGEVVRPQYTCTQPDDPGALDDCSAVDEVGDSLRSGGALATRIPGLHSLTVSATSSDGLVTSDTVNYTVLPDNRFTLSRLTSSGGAVALALALPGPARITAVELSGHEAVGRYNRTVETKRTITIHIRSTAPGRPRLGSPAARRITVQVTFTPRGGRSRRVTRHGVALR